MSAFGGKVDAPHGVFYEYTPYLNETARLIVGVAGMVKQNEAAIELWRQIFATLANAEDATLVDADYNPTEDEARFREAFAQAGWSEEETQFRLDLLRKQEAGAPVTSPGVSPHVEFLFGLLCDDIEAAMERLHIESHGRVARGIEPRAGPLAANTNVVMTDEGIITVGSFLFRFCGLIARAFTRTLHRAPTFWESANYSHDLARAYVRDDPKLVAYWLRIFLSFSTTGTHVMVPFQPAKRHELVVFEQVARAMEIFAIAHEYGHHHLDPVDPAFAPLEVFIGIPLSLHLDGIAADLNSRPRKRHNYATPDEVFDALLDKAANAEHAGNGSGVSFGT